MRSRKNPLRRREPVCFAVRCLLYVIYGVPLVWIVLTSLKRQGDVLKSQASIFFTPTLDAYRELLADPQMFSSLKQSIIIAAGTMLLCLFFAVPLAYALAKVNSTVVVLCLSLLIILQMIPQTANIIPLFTIYSRLGILNNTAAVVVADAVMLIPWATLLIRPFYAVIPDALEEASAIDGAGRFRTFFLIVLPIVRNGIFTVGALLFLSAWGEMMYAINLFLDPAKYPMSALIAQQTSSFGVDWPAMMALAVISAVPVLIVYAFSYRQLRDGLTVGSVK